MTLRILSVSFILLITCTSLYSQNRQRPNRPTPPSIEDRVQTLLVKLGQNIDLSEDQLSSSEKVFTNYFESIDDLRKGNSRPDRDKIQSIDKKRDTDFEAILTDTQKKKYLDIKEELFQQRQRQRPNN